jgi:hypothetical protein
VLRAFCTSIDKAARDTFINLTFSIEIIKTLNKNNIKGSFGMVLWTALVLAHREALSTVKKQLLIESLPKARAIFVLGARTPKMWLLPAPPTFYTHHLKQTQEKLFYQTNCKTPLTPLEKPKS